MCSASAPGKCWEKICVVISDLGPPAVEWWKVLPHGENVGLRSVAGDAHRGGGSHQGRGSVESFVRNRNEEGRREWRQTPRLVAGTLKR